FGQHFLPVSQASQIAGRFNGHLKNKLLVFIDEGFWAGDKAAEGVLKSIVTEPWIAIEQKNQDTIRVRNHVNLMMASNNDWVVPANKGERRFHVLDIPDAKQGDHGYFDKLMHQMYKKGGLEAMLYDLLKADFSDVNLSKFENTKGLFEQKVHTMSTEMQYWYERLQDGRLLSYREDDNEYGDFSNGVTDDWMDVKTTDQHRDYLIYVDKMKERFPKSSTEFGIFLTTVCPWVKRFRKRTGSNLEWWRRFPPLAECREEFEKQIKTKVEWDHEDSLDEPDLF
ncbi:MAG TPA: primase-helicase family protein, partial [Bacteroidales bacterium]|nr:primase-helicase family protein [Bacteroidales bacterium]